MIKIDGGGYVKPVQPKPAPKPAAEHAQIKHQDQGSSAKKAEVNALGASIKLKVEKLFAAQSLMPKTNGKGILSDNDKGISPLKANYVSPYNSAARPEEAASFLKYDTALSTPASKSTAFAEALETHKSDSEWTKNFLSAVGSEKVAEYTGGIYSIPNANKEQINKYSDTIRGTLEGLVNSGDLKQEGMNKLVDKLKDKNPYAFSEIVGKSTDDKFRQMFVNSAVANGDDRLDAAASLVLSKMSPEKQSAFLTQLDKSGKLDAFIEGAMVGQTKMIPLDYHLDNPNASWGDAPKVSSGGVEKILQNAGIQTAYNGSQLEQAPFSKDLQNSIFNAATRGLNNDKAFENFQDNVEFKNSLAKVFTQNRDQILQSLTKNNDIPDSDIAGLSRFVELTLFTPPLGDKNSASLNSLPDTISNLIGDLTTKARENNDLGSARLAGRLFGAIDNAAERASKQIEDSKEARDKFVDTVVGLAFDLIPLPGAEKLGEGGSELLKKVLGGLEGALKEGTIDKIQTMTADQAKKFLTEQLKGNDELKSELQQQVFKNLFAQAKDQLGKDISPNQAARLLTDFESAYTYIDFGNEGENPMFK